MISNGIDLVRIDRFKRLMNDDTFINSYFSIDEINYIKKTNNVSTMAGIFASKEAFLKAIKKGINNYSLKDIEISHDNNNCPFIILHGNLKEIYNLNNISVSISHDGDYAIAIVSIII